MDRVYDKKKIIIKKSALTKESVKDRFDYIKEVSKIVSIQTDERDKILEKIETQKAKQCNEDNKNECAKRRNL